MWTDITPPGRTRTLRRCAPARLAALAAALCLTFAQQPAAAAEFRDRSVIGTWKLVSVLDLASIASLDAAEAKTLLGKILTISETNVKVDQEVCAPPEFWAERIMPEPHMQEKLHSTAERLRLPNPATMVELGCTDVYIRNAGELVLLWGGAMFDAVRVDANRRPRTAGLQARKLVASRTGPGKVRKTGAVQDADKAHKTGVGRQPTSIQDAASVRKTSKSFKNDKARKAASVRKAAGARKRGNSPRLKTGASLPGTYPNELV